MIYGFCYRWCGGGGVVLKLIKFGLGSYGLHVVYGFETVLEKGLENRLERELGCGLRIELGCGLERESFGVG